MPLATEVTLPKSHTPAWPDKCIVCHAKPDSRAKITQNAQNPFLAFLLPFMLLFGWSRVEFPICRKCKPRFLLQRWGCELICWTVIIAAIFWLMPYFKDWSSFTRKVAICACLLVIILPNIIAEVIWPRIFDTTVKGDEIDYEFSSEDYAAEFQALNLRHINRSDLETADVEVASAWQERKSVLMEDMLGKEHDMVMHAIIPFAVGGALDLYYYPNGVKGTGIATKELSEHPGEGASNRVFGCYEIVMFTRHALNLADAKNEETPFGHAHRNISSILNPMARFCSEASLNPNETCEFPQDMERIGGKCLIFDSYGQRHDDLGGVFGLLLIIEVFPSEMKFAREHSGADLIEKLKQAGHHPYSDLDREPVA